MYCVERQIYTHFFSHINIYIANKLHAQLLRKTLKPRNYIMLPFTHKQLKQILRACRLQNSKKLKRQLTNRKL